MSGLASGRWYGLAALLLPFAALFLFLLADAAAIRRQRRAHGARRRGGYLPRSAYTGTKARGTRTQVTATTEGCSSYSLRGIRLEDESDLTALLRESNYSVRTSSIGATDRGASGEQRRRAG